MKNRILSFVLALVLVVSTLLGTAVFAGAEEKSAEITATALNLAENVTVTMQVKVTNPAADDYALVTAPGKAPVKYVFGEVTADGVYYFTAEVDVKDYEKEILVDFYSADDVKYASDTTTVKAYCDTYFEKQPGGEFTGLINKFLVYANAADYYFDDAKTLTSFESVDLTELVAAADRQGVMPAGILHRSATLLLESETTIRHYFHLENGKYIQNYQFFLDKDGDKVADADEILTPASKLTDDGLTTVYYVDIAGITPNELDKVYTVGVYGKADGKTYTCAYAALTYLRGKAASKDKELANLVAAIYNYNTEAGKLIGAVKFDDGTTMTYEYGVETPIVYVPTKAGSDFVGWYDANGIKYDTVPASATKELELVAKYATSHESVPYDASAQKSGQRFFCFDHVIDETVAKDGKCDLCGKAEGACTAAHTRLEADGLCDSCKKEKSKCTCAEGFKDVAATTPDGYCNTCGYKTCVTDHEFVDEINRDCKNCNYCVDYAPCVISADNLTKRNQNCPSCGNAYIGKAGSTIAGISTSAADKGYGYAKKINIDGKEVLLWGSMGGTFYSGYGNNLATTIKAGTSKVFAFSLEVGLPSEELYGQYELNTSHSVPNHAPQLYFRTFGYKGSAKSGDIVPFSLTTDGYVSFATTGKTGYKIPTDTVEKITIVFDYSALSDAEIGDGVADACRMYILDSKGNIAASQTYTFKSGSNSYDVAEMVYSNFVQLRLQGGGGRILLGDFSQTMFNNYVVASDESVMFEYTPGVATDLPVLTKAGYLFGGWYLDEALTQPVSAVPANATGKLVLYPNWIPTVFAGDFTDYTYEEDTLLSYGNYCEHESATDDNVCDKCGCCVAHIVENGACTQCGYKVTRCSSHTDNATKDGQGNVLSEEKDGKCDVCNRNSATITPGSIDGFSYNAGGEYNSGYAKAVINGDSSYLQLNLDISGPTLTYNTKNSISNLLADKEDKSITYSFRVMGDAKKAMNLALRMRYVNNSTMLTPITFTTAVTGLGGVKICDLPTDKFIDVSFVIDFDLGEVRYYVDGVYVTRVALTGDAADYTKYDSVNCSYDNRMFQARVNGGGTINFESIYVAVGDHFE